jgi:hypothetical protein
VSGLRVLSTSARCGGAVPMPCVLSIYHCLCDLAGVTGDKKLVDGPNRNLRTSPRFATKAMGAGKCCHLTGSYSIILSPQALIDVVSGRSNAAVSRPTHEGDRGDGWIQVGPGRASATQGVRLNGLPESVPNGQRRMQSTPWGSRTSHLCCWTNSARGMGGNPSIWMSSSDSWERPRDIDPYPPWPSIPSPIPT